MEDDNIQKLNSKNSHKFIFLSLYEIFGNVLPDNIIRRVCCDCKWNFDNCVQTLIKYAEDSSNNIRDNSILKNVYTRNASETEPRKNLILYNSYDNTFCEKKQGAIPKNPSILFSDKAKEFDYTIKSKVNNLSCNMNAELDYTKGRHDLQYLPNFEEIANHINSCHKIMIIMRGAPGSGKSYYAKKIIDLTVRGDYKEFIHSTDNYFYSSSEKYCYDPQSLTDAHEYNQKIVRQKAVEGWSPIIVDNTNTKIWEMLPYVKIAIQNGYLIEIVQPNTPWCTSALRLSKKNIHGVPKKKIENILNNFEPINKNKIVEMVKTVQYSVPLPQMRRHPNIPVNLSPNSENTINNSILSKNNVDNNFNKFESSRNCSLICTTGAKKDICPKSPHLSRSKISTGKNQYQSMDSKQRNAKNNIQKLQVHALNCPNENKSFYEIRKNYPNNNVFNLWELFVKCNGVTDNLINILLNDSNYSELNSKDQNTNILFTCNCDTQNKQINVDILPNRANAISKNANHMKIEDANHSVLKVFNTTENRSIVDDINDQSEDLYSGNCKTKHGYDEKTIFTSDEGNELFEINLGKEFIQQLENIFGFETKLKESLTKCHTNIFMPKTLAKQIYSLWMESLYNQLEEQKHITIKEDEAFAKFLETYLTESDNLDVDTADNIELAWFKYNSDEQYSSNSTRENLESYSHLIKLFQTFPQIQKEIILEVFQAHGYGFNETVMVLNNSINTLDSNDLNCLKSKNEKNYSEQAKRTALRDFETNRNHAAHHSQLKAECFEKAKEAIKRNSASVAVYYSHIANFHNSKIDMCNQKAANCIMEVNDWKQTNPDFIDLHYLHTMEAIESLDLFLDKHINKLKSITRTYKYIFIITGRGLHSAGGISTIKNKVKSRLKDRNLKWSEVNPGLLKVKLFSASKFSQNC